MKKKLLIYSIIMLMAMTLVSAASFSRDMPARISPGEDLTITFSVSGAETGKVFTVEDTVPSGWALKSWDVTGAQETKDKINHRFVDGTRHGWSFTAASSNLQIKYVLTVPQSANGAYNFNAVWFDSSGFYKNDGSTTVRVIKCGDSVCEGSEDSNNCEADCPKPVAPPVHTVACGDSVCEGSEDSNNCEADCPKPVVPPVKPTTGLSPTTGLIIAAVIIVLGIAAYFLFFRKKE